MAITHPLSAQMWLSQFATLAITTDGEELAFSVTHGAITIFTQTYIPDEDGRVVIYDLDKVIEPHMTSPMNLFQFSFGSGMTTLHVLVVKSRVNIQTPALTFNNEHFFTTMEQSRTTALGRTEVLTLMLNRVALMTVDATYYSPDRGVVTAHHTGTVPSGLQTVNVSPDLFEDEVGTLTAYTVRIGDRSATFQVRPLPAADVTLVFSNAFGCPEYLYLTGKDETSPEYERSTAVVGGNEMVYHIDEKIMHTSSTGPLKHGGGMLALDCARSLDVRLVTASGNIPVIITEVETTISNNDSEMDRVELTWRLSSRYNSLLKPLSEPEYFTPEFDKTYQ